MSVPAFGQTWEYQETVDELTEERSGMAILEEGDKGLGVICVGDQPRIVGMVGEYLGSNSDIRGAYRFRGEEGTEATTYVFEPHLNGSGFLFQTHNSREILELLAKNSDITVRVRDYRGTSHTHTFSLAGSRNALERLDCVSFDEEGNVEISGEGAWELTEDRTSAIVGLPGGDFFAMNCPNTVVIFTSETLEYSTETETIGGVEFLGEGESESSFYTFQYMSSSKAALLRGQEDFDFFLRNLTTNESLQFLFQDIVDEYHRFTIPLSGSREILSQLSCVDFSALEEENSENEDTETPVEKIK